MNIICSGVERTMWLIARTKPNQEKRAKINLENQNFTVFLPSIERKKFKKNLWVSTKELLFHGYIFIEIGDHNQNISKINNTVGVSKLLVDYLSLKAQVVPESIVSEIRMRIKVSPNDVDNIKTNDKLQITNGSQNSLSAIFIEKCTHNRSKVLINILNSQREVIIPNSDLQLSL